MENELTDEEILEGLRKKNNYVTRHYFYEYCRIAYYIYNKEYGLQGKPGMDFYSLTHEYYLALDKQNWKQLEDRKPNMSLKTWMTNGFRYLILDQLKQYNKEFAVDDIYKRVNDLELEFDIPNSEFKEDVRRTIEEISDMYFGRDNKKAILLKMLLVEGYKGKEVAEQLGMTPSAVTQQYHKLMNAIVIPYFKRYYESEEGAYAYKDSKESQILFRIGKSASELAKTVKIINKVRALKKIRKMDVKEFLKNRVTPDYITTLEPNEIFVFGSNLAGMHGGGAARIARIHFGAVMGVGVGLQGQSYAIPTMQGGTETIEPYVNEFIEFAKNHPEMRFLVTRIGCGIAGFDPEDIAPLFEEALPVENICLPIDFWDVMLDV